MSTSHLQQIHPVLPVKNVTEALAYYVDRLGFSVAFKDAGDDPKYGGVTRDSIEIHLQWHDEKEWEIDLDRPLLRIYVENVDALFHELKEKDVFHSNTCLKDTVWGTREFGIYDIGSNGLIFYRNL
ncbi:MAG: glyoxalase/bleomycin resistance/extradiol dioxygenase family protein [Algicola sp.]|nr:glyoxalase/bleomycin resistance/extradiol dioxygenase family protein [Algicola sp.]